MKQRRRPECRKLTERQVIAVLGARGELSSRQISQRLGISYSGVAKIWRGEVYKDIWQRFHGDAR